MDTFLLPAIVLTTDLIYVRCKPEQLQDAKIMTFYKLQTHVEATHHCNILKQVVYCFDQVDHDHLADGRQEHFESVMFLNAD